MSSAEKLLKKKERGCYNYLTTTMIFDIKTSNGNVISTLNIDNSMVGYMSKIYDEKYLEGLENMFGIVILEQRVEKDVTFYRTQIKQGVSDGKRNNLPTL